jgi:tetratricopeptide (TPR) repeat protein
VDFGGQPWQGDFHSDLAVLLHQARPPADWEAFLRRHAAHPQVTTAAELARDLHPDSPGHLRAAARAFLRRNDVDRAALLLRAALALCPDRAAALAGQAELLLQAGYRHEAAALWRERFAWQTAFPVPGERDREDWRAEARLELVGFLWRAGFPDEAHRQLTRLLEAAREGDPLRPARVAALAAGRFPAFVTAEQVLRVTGSPLTLLRLAVGRPGWERVRDHVISQLAILLPEAPEVAWLACVWQNREAACLDAQALGVDPPGGVRLPVLLPLLDRLQGLDTAERPAVERLALHAIRWRVRVVSPDWRFVEETLLRE